MMEAERISRPGGSSRAHLLANVNSSGCMLNSIFIQTTIIAQITHGMQDWYSRVYRAVSVPATQAKIQPFSEKTRTRIFYF
jgi:hypothetical protein